jgi:hypothetical protein
MSSRRRPVWLEERLRRQYSEAALERAGIEGGARFYLKQWRVDDAMTGADELDNTRELDAILAEANGSRFIFATGDVDAIPDDGRRWAVITRPFDPLAPWW